MLFRSEDIFTLIELQEADRLCTNEYTNIDDLVERRLKLEKILNENYIYKKNPLMINGNDLIRLGYSQGKIIGEILDYLFERVLEEAEKNNREDLIKMVKEKF